MKIRQARPADYEAVTAFTRDTWPERGGDYIPRVFRDWIADDGPTQRTFVIDVRGEDSSDDLPPVPDEVVGLVQGRLLTEYEAWGGGLRIDPEYRGRGLAVELSRAMFAWARERGASVMRSMIFSWNAPSLAHARKVGFEPSTEFRWAHPTPDSEATPGLRVTADPDGGWAFWSASDARTALRGLALDDEESWALSELTRERLHQAATEGRLFTVQEGGTRALALRNQVYERPVAAEDRDRAHGEDGGDRASGDEGEEPHDNHEIDEASAEGDPDVERDGGTERWAEYAVGVWADLDAAEALFAAIARDAAAVDADRTRVLIPESPRWVSDTASIRAGIADEPDFVMAADLTDESIVGR